MSWKQATGLIIVGATLLIMLYDLAAYYFGGNAATISRICLETSTEYRGFSILVAFAVGVLLGHLFLPQHVGK